MALFLLFIISFIFLPLVLVLTFLGSAIISGLILVISVYTKKLLNEWSLRTRELFPGKDFAVDLRRGRNVVGPECLLAGLGLFWTFGGAILFEVELTSKQHGLIYIISTIASALYVSLYVVMVYKLESGLEKVAQYPKYLSVIPEFTTEDSNTICQKVCTALYIDTIQYKDVEPPIRDEEARLRNAARVELINFTGLLSLMFPLAWIFVISMYFSSQLGN